MTTEIAAAQDSVTNLPADQGNGSQLAPGLQRGQLPKMMDGKAPLPLVEMTGRPQVDGSAPPNVSSQSVSELRDPCNFLAEVAKNFTRIDLDRDEVLTRQEVGVFSARPYISARQKEMSNVLLGHWDDFAAIGGNGNGIDKSGIKHLAKVTYPNIEEFNPSFSGTVGRGTAGGAAGGAAVAAWNGDKVGEGAGKGAAVGAVVGAIAYTAAKADYNQLVRERANVSSWNYFDLGKCDIAGAEKATHSALVNLLKGGTNSDLDSDALLRSTPRTDAELKQLVPLIKGFAENTFGKIDFDRDGALSKSELAEGLNSKYIPAGQRKFAEILYRNHEQLVGPGSSTMPYYRLDELAGAADRDVVMANLKSNHKEATLFGGIMGAGMGIFPGSLLLVGMVPKITGPALGGVILGLAALGAGIGYLATRPSQAKADSIHKSLREAALAGTLQELRTLKHTDAMRIGPAK